MYTWLKMYIHFNLTITLSGEFRNTFVLHFSSVQSLSHVRLFVTPWTAVHQASLSIINSWSLLKLWSSCWWCHPTISPSVVPFSSSLQSFLASGSLQKCQFFASGGQSIWVSVSVSVLPMNIQDWFPLGWTLFVVQGMLKSFLQHRSPTASFLWHSAFFGRIHFVRMLFHRS